MPSMAELLEIVLNEGLDIVRAALSAACDDMKEEYNESYIPLTVEVVVFDN